jgi:hypothetical protein
VQDFDRLTDTVSRAGHRSSKRRRRWS